MTQISPGILCNLSDFAVGLAQQDGQERDTIGD